MAESPEEQQLIEDVEQVGKALNVLTKRAKALGIEMSVTAYYDSTRVDINLKRTSVDFDYTFEGERKGG